MDITSNDSDNGFQQFHEARQEPVAFNVVCSLRVAGGVSDSGEILNLQKSELALRSGLSKGTITKLTSRDPRDVKPDLETLCKLSLALNISPAFLLMTAQDWELLLQAFNTLRMLAEPDGEQERKLVELLRQGVTRHDVAESVRTGLDFMEQLQNEQYSSEEQRRQQAGILAMTAMAQAAVRRQQSDKKAFATALGALLGNREVSSC